MMDQRSVDWTRLRHPSKEEIQIQDLVIVNKQAANCKGLYPKYPN